MAASSIAGCASIERETGINLPTQQGAVAGATFGGIVAAIANANPAWIAASVVLGGVAGGAIGNELGKKDAQKHASTNMHALDTLAAGQTQSWSNSKTGNSGSTTVHRVRRQETGAVCKTYTETVRTRKETVTRDGTACKMPGGSWKQAT
jgi:surface antigen